MQTAITEQRFNLNLLPDRAKEELFDFYEFLVLKYHGHHDDTKEKLNPVLRIHEELSRLETDSLTHLEQEFENYKEQYPHEAISGQ